MNEPIETPPAPMTRGRRWRRRIKRVVIVLGILYPGLCILFAAFQNKIIFPGTATHGTPESVVQPSAANEIVRLTLPDQTPIVARFSRAVGIDSKRAPTVLFFYGNGMCMADTDGEVQLLRLLGCNVLVPDYPGFGMSGGEPSEASLYATADAAYAHLEQRKDIDPKRIIAMGWSIGGAVAIDIAGRKPVIGLITLSSFTTLPEMARHLFPWLPTSLLLKYRFDNEAKIRQIKVPTLIIHGQSDTMVPAAMAQRLSSAAGAQVTTLIVPGADHNDLFFVGQDPIGEALQHFLAKLR